MNDGRDVNINALQAQRINGAWYVQQPDSPYWGKGETLEAAYADLSQRSADYAAFSKESGLPVFEVRAISVKGLYAFQKTWRSLRIIIIVALCAVPLSYGISSGLKRTIDDVGLKGGKQFWAKVEKGILNMGANNKELPPEKVEALNQAISNIVERVRPFSSQLPLLFVQPEQKASVRKNMISEKSPQ